MSYALSMINPAGMLYNMADDIIPVQAGRMETDLALVRAFKDGDRASFEELVRKYKDRVYRLVFSIIRDTHEADDIAQVVFVKVYLKIDTFREKSSFFTWLYSIAVNECRHSLRKRKRAFLSLDAPLSAGSTVRLGDVVPSCEKDHESRLINEEQARLANRLIDALPEKYRAAYVLRNVDGLSYTEIAGIMGISVNRVKIRLFRAREKLDAQIHSLYDSSRAGGASQ